MQGPALEMNIDSWWVGKGSGVSDVTRLLMNYFARPVRDGMPVVQSTLLR